MRKGAKIHYRKRRPSMPLWWEYFESCALCRNRNNCNSCKCARLECKAAGSKDMKLARLKDKRSILNGNMSEYDIVQ